MQKKSNFGVPIFKKDAKNRHFGSNNTIFDVSFKIETQTRHFKYPNLKLGRLKLESGRFRREVGSFRRLNFYLGHLKKTFSICFIN